MTSAKKRRDELEKDCQTKFDCPVSGLGSLISEFESLAAKEVAEAEKILGISGGVAPAQESVETDAADEPSPEPAPKMSAREALLAREGRSLADIARKRTLNTR